jgi:hypothetical protein
VRGADVRIEADAEHVRFLKGIAHPIRLELLGILSYRNISPVEFARHRREPVSNLNYHFKKLEELECIELAGTRSVKGSIEHIYRRVKRVVFSDRDWLVMPDVQRQIVSSSILRDLIGRVTQALQAGTLTAREDFHMTWRPLHLDEPGWSAAMKILMNAYDALTQVEVDAIERMRESEEKGFEATVAMLGFESPHSEDLDLFTDQGVKVDVHSVYLEDGNPPK